MPLEKKHTRRKILMLAPELGYGGAETYFVRLSTLLSQHHDVTIALFSRNYRVGQYSAAGLEPQCPVLLIDDAEVATSRPVRWINRWRKVKQLKCESDLAISFLSGPNLLNAITWNSSKTVVTMLGSRKFDPNIKPSLRFFYQKIIDPLIFKLATQVVSVSNGLSNELTNFKRDVVITKFKTIEVLLDAEEIISKASEPIEEEYLKLKGLPIIVVAGRLSTEKGFQHLIDLFIDVSKIIKNAKLLIIGDGPLYLALVQQCKLHGLRVNDFEPDNASVIFTGYRESPLRYFRIARIFVLSSLTEGFPNILVEALASGILTIASNGPWGARAVLYDNPANEFLPFPTRSPETADYGLLMPRIDDSMNRRVWVEQLCNALTNSSFYRDLSARGPDRVRDLDMRIIGQKWLNLISELMSVKY